MNPGTGRGREPLADSPRPGRGWRGPVAFESRAWPTWPAVPEPRTSWDPGPKHLDWAHRFCLYGLQVATNPPVSEGQISVVKLSVSLNFFDGGELLVPCLAAIRPGVDHASVVFQETSNFGNPVAASARAALREAVSLGLADQVLTYVPQPDLGGARNEYGKRAAGIKLAQEAGADAILFLDVDEFYELAPFLRAKRRMVEENLDFTTVRYKSYYRFPTWRLHGPAEDKVPFICRLTPRTRHILSGPYPVDVDPTRRIQVEGGRHHLFAGHEILMHHMTGVRLDIQEKIANSTNNDRQESRDRMSGFLNGMAAMHPGSGLIPNGDAFHIETTRDRFNLMPIFAGKGTASGSIAVPGQTFRPSGPDTVAEVETRLCALPWQKFTVNTQTQPPRAAPCRNYPLSWNAWDTAGLSFALQVTRSNLVSGSLDVVCAACKDKPLAPLSALADLLDREGLSGYDGNRMIDAIGDMDSEPFTSPPAHLSYRVAHTTDSHEFRISGLVSLFDIMMLVSQHGSKGPCRLLDWGSGSGRIAAHIAQRYPHVSLTGCDIDAEAVEWCNRQIGGDRFHLIEAEPPTSFVDGQFNAIIGFSIVTHLAQDLQKSWVSELHRLLDEDGIVVLTMLGERAAQVNGLLERLTVQGVIDERLDPTLDDIAPRGYYRSTFQSRAWTEAVWGKRFEIVEYIESGAFGLQDIVVLRKRPAYHRLRAQSDSRSHDCQEVMRR